MSGAVAGFLPVLELLLNHALRLDEETMEQLESLDEVEIFLELTDIGARIQFQPIPGGVRLSMAGDSEEEPLTGAAEVLIRGELRALLLAVFRGEGSGLPKGLSLHGDIELARRIETLLYGYDPDLEERLAAWVGDVAARRIITGGSGMVDLFRSGTQKLCRDLYEYLAYESLILLDPVSQERFVTEIDNLRDWQERLVQRIENLERQLG